MNELGLIQDLAIVLLAAGAAGIICRRLGLSVIVGYLVAGIVVGPYTPPFSWVLDVERIQTLSQVGLVFLMFGIGLGLSLGKLRRMGAPTLLATGLGAFFMLNATQLLGRIVGWSFNQSLFIAAMFMVSSSAVIAKVLGELNLMHDRAGQVALSMTVLEDVVAVVMLTILVSHSGGGSANVGTLLTGMSAFVVLLVMAGLLMVPKVLRRLEARADPEIQTIIVAGMLFLLAITAAKAGYSLALGAFLLGAIVAEIPQRASVERAFAGMRDLFSSVFFVSIGMMIEVHLLLGVWAWILGLGLFVLVARPLATGLALILCGTKPHEARRAGLLLSPLGEFSFIIAQLGVAAGVLPKPYYPLAVGVSIFTVLAMPVLNRFGEPIIGWAERAEPRWVSNTFEAYHGWLAHVQTSASGSIAWKLVHGRLVQVAMEMLFITGMMTFSRQMLDLVIGWTATFDVNPGTIEYFFWSAVTLVVLIPLVAIWRNVAAFSMILGEGLGTALIPPTAVQSAIKAIAALILGYWLYLIVPAEQFGWWGWLAIAVIAVMIVAIFSNRLVYWHSQWQSSVREVLEEGPTDIKAASTDSALAQRERDLKDWKVRLGDCIIPDGSSCGGQTLAELSIPDRFGCVVLEVERNGIVITAIRPDFRVYPGDRLLLMGHDEKLKTIRQFLAGNGAGHNQSEGFNLSVLETFRVPDGVGNGRTLAELQVGPRTGVRVVGIRRGETEIIAPSGQERLQCGDDVLVAGTLSAIGEFRRWLSPGK